MKKGFVMLIVMMILFMMGIEFFILTSTSNFIGFQTNNAYLEADRQNLVSSGLALAIIKKPQIGEIIEPETADLASPMSKLSIKIENRRDVTISTFCRRGGREAKTRGTFKISQ